MPVEDCDVTSNIRATDYTLSKVRGIYTPYQRIVGVLSCRRLRSNLKAV